MSTESIRVSTVIPASAARIFTAWLDSREHARFTGGGATVSPKVGGKFTAWDGYIEGKNLELKPERRIVQSWRTTEFPEDSPDSRLEVLLEPASGGTRVTLVHTEIPAGQGERYRTGWEQFYFQPMQKYFGKEAKASVGKRASVKPAPRKRPPVKAAAKSAAKAEKKAARASLGTRSTPKKSQARTAAKPARKK